MTKDQIDDLMRDNGIMVVGEAVYSLVQLVIQKEREECAKLCENLLDEAGYPAWNTECAAAIRARSQQ